ncbi:radical SAM protein [Megalodesulfovibrio paquesii]
MILPSCSRTADPAVRSTRPAPPVLSTLAAFWRGRVPGQVVIQYTDRCNAACAQCGMRVDNVFPRSTMGPDAARRLIDAMAARGVQAISFTGGEPLLYLKDIPALADYARAQGIRYIRTGTNGFIFRNHEAPDFLDKIDRVAETLARSAINTFWISLDSAEAEAHEGNRGLPGVVAGIRKALPRFHAAGLYPAANLGINRSTGGLGARYLHPAPPAEFHAHAVAAFERFYDTVAELGFTMANACYPMSLPEAEAEDAAVYTATSGADMIRFTPQEKVQLFKALYDVIPRRRHLLRIFSPRASLLALIRQYERGERTAYPCRGGIDFFFVDAKDLNTYPCGYRGEENLGKFWDLKLEDLAAAPDCTRCDWECFRDPSELLGPLVDGLRHPLRTLSRLRQDPEMARTWWEDLRYYKACGFFDATVPPNQEALAAWRRAEGRCAGGCP